MKNILLSERGLNPIYQHLGVTEAFIVKAEGRDVILAEISAAQSPAYDTVRAEECAAGWWKVSYFNTASQTKLEDLILEEELSKVIPTALGLNSIQTITLH